MECGATVHPDGPPDGRRRRTASILAGIAAGLLCGLAQAQEVKTLRWTPPTERVDGTALSADQLAAHRVLCEPGIDVSVPMPATSWAGVEPGIESCVVRAVDQDGLESVDSARVYPEWEPEPQPDPPGAPTNVRVVAELPPSTGPPGGEMTAILRLEWNGDFSSNVWTAASPSVPTGQELTRSAAGVTIAADSGLGNMRVLQRASSAYADVAGTLDASARLDHTGGALLILIDPRTSSGNAPFVDLFNLAAASNGSFNINRTAGGDLYFDINWNGWNSYNSVSITLPSNPFWLWMKIDPDNATVAQRLQYRVWEYGDSVPGSFTTTSGGGSAATSGNFAAPDYLEFFKRDASEAPMAVGLMVIDDNPDADMSSYLPSSGSTAEAGLETGAPVLAASANVERTVSAALGVPALSLAGAADIERTASAELELAAVQLSASTGVIREASAALGIAPLELAASGSIERNASVSLVVPQPSLEATAGAGRTASAALEITAPSLLSDVMISRTASAALDVPAAVLAADLGADKTVAAALITPSPALSSQVSVVRLASGELALAVPVLAASAIGEELTVSGTLQTPVPVLDMDAMISRTASGALELALPVLDGDVSRSANVEAVLIVRAPEMAAQAAIARFASGELTLAELELAAQAFQGAIQPVIGLRATVRQIGYRSGVTMIGKKGTIQ